MDKIDKIKELKKMLDEKVINQEEFEVMKQEVLENKKLETAENISNEKVNKNLYYIRYWEKGILTSVILFVITFILKVFTNGVLWDFGTITLWITIILFIVSIISGWYNMHKNKEKWPTWYTIIAGIIIALVIINIISAYIERADEKRVEAVRQQIERELSNN